MGLCSFFFLFFFLICFKRIYKRKDENRHQQHNSKQTDASETLFPFPLDSHIKKKGVGNMAGRYFSEIFYLVFSLFSVLFLLLSSPVLMLILMMERVAWVRRILLG